MRRSFETYLWDIQNAGYNILRCTTEKTLDDYMADKQLSLSVELSFEIIGEAIVQATQHYPLEASALTQCGEIIGFRTMLAHRDHAIIDKVVWDIVQTDLLPLIAEVTVLLDEWHQG